MYTPDGTTVLQRPLNYWVGFILLSTL